MSKKVIAYEDDPNLRRQLESVFYSIRQDYDLLATFPHPLNVLDQVREFQPDVVLMDLQMLEEDDGLLALYKIKRTTPQVKVLVLTLFDVDYKIFHALCLDADGYMLKSDFSANRVPHEAMRKSLSIMYENGAYLTPSVAKQIMKLFSDASIGDKMKKVKEKFASIFQGDADEKYKGTELTKMQKLVLAKIVDGMTTAEIATDLELSENTINTHIKAIYSILGVHSRALAIKKAMELKWSL